MVIRLGFAVEIIGPVTPTRQVFPIEQANKAWLGFEIIGSRPCRMANDHDEGRGEGEREGANSIHRGGHLMKMGGRGGS